MREKRKLSEKESSNRSTKTRERKEKPNTPRSNAKMTCEDIVQHLNSIQTVSKLKILANETIFLGMAGMHTLGHLVSIYQLDTEQMNYTLMAASLAWMSRFLLLRILWPLHWRTLKWVWPERKLDLLVGLLMVGSSAVAFVRLVCFSSWRNLLLWLLPVLIQIAVLRFQSHQPFCPGAVSGDLVMALLPVLLRAVEAAYFVGVCPLFFVQFPGLYYSMWTCLGMSFWTAIATIIILGWRVATDAKPLAGQYANDFSSPSAPFIQNKTWSFKISAAINTYLKQLYDFTAKVLKLMTEIGLILFFDLWFSCSGFLLSSVFTIVFLSVESTADQFKQPGR